jgi:cytochrome b6-f complex iron-sulfur subunit
LRSHPEGGPRTAPWTGRRKFLLGAFLTALAGAYGVFAGIAVKFVFPKRKQPRRIRVFIAFAEEITVGASKAVVMPSGDQLLLSNTGRLNPSTGNTLIAFSNSCPHLGCKVHWEAQRERFVCPCHQGVFNASGVAISGPPAQSGKSLSPYWIEVEGDSIYAVVEEA